MSFKNKKEIVNGLDLKSNLLNTIFKWHYFFHKVLNKVKQRFYLYNQILIPRAIRYLIISETEGGLSVHPKIEWLSEMI